MAGGQQDKRLEKHGEFFDVWSRFYGATPFLGRALRQAQDLAVVHLAPLAGERILDLGCGPGRGTLALLKAGSEVVMADYSPAMIGKARRNTGGRAAPIRADAGRLPFADQSFDGLLCTNSFHHYPEPEASLREMRRVLRPGGRLSLVDPAEEALISRVAIHWVERRLFGLKEVHLHTAGEWNAMLRAAGFTEVVAEPGPWHSPMLRPQMFVLAYA